MHVLNRLRLPLLVGLALAVAWVVPGPQELRAGLLLFVLIAGLWLTQALPLAVTALAVPLLAVLLGLLTPRQALASFAHPIIFLFLGGFALAAALVHQGLDRALARAVLRLAQGRILRAVLLLCALTALLSMWISNTAAVAMMLPLALGLLREEGVHAGVREKSFVLLALAYSASIGGMGTLIGSPPNAIAAAQAGISFSEWLRLGLPLVALMWPVMLLVLALLLRPHLSGQVGVPDEALVWTRERRLVAAIFALTVAGWIGGAPLGRWLGITQDMDTVVALAALVAVCATGVIGWRELERDVHWGVLLLFGGGLALSEVMGSSGASRFLAEALLAQVQQAPLVLLVLGVLAFVVLLTELVSNTASAALLLPVFLTVAVPLGLPPVPVAAAIAVAASCAFMLPVATPPNAIVYASGEVSQATMMRCGAWLNVMAVLVIGACAAWGWP